MKTIGAMIVACSIIFGVTGCSQSLKSTNKVGSQIPSSNSTHQTSWQLPTSIVVVSKTNLDEWNVTPRFATSKSGFPMVDMTIKYHGNSVPAKLVKISFGSASSELQELRNNDHIVLGTSYENDTKLTFTVSWNEGNQNMQGTEVLSLR